MERKLLTFCYWICESCHRALSWIAAIDNTCLNASVYFYNLRVDLDKELEEEKVAQLTDLKERIYEDNH